MGEKARLYYVRSHTCNAMNSSLQKNLNSSAFCISHIRAEARTKKASATRKRIMHEETASSCLLIRNTNFKWVKISDRAVFQKVALYYYFSDREAPCRQSWRECWWACKDIAHTIGNSLPQKRRFMQSSLNLLLYFAWLTFGLAF